MKLYPNVTIIVCIWALSVLTIFYFGFSTLPKSGLFPNEFIRSLANWDGGHYLGIAEINYQKFQYAFFPLYPLAINLVSKITGSFLLAGILISALSSFFAFQLFYELISMEFGKQYAKRSLIALLIFPMSFYFLTVYSEGLFFLLTVSMFVALRKGNLFLATVAASLASVTRLAGLALVLSLFANLYFMKKFNRKNWFVLFAPLGFIMYCFYLYQNTGDPFYFISAESYWHRNLTVPGLAFISSFRQLIVPGYIPSNVNALFDFIFAIFGIGMVWRIWRKLSIDYAIFSSICLALPLFSPTILAVPRYLLTIFPIFIVAGMFKNQYAVFAYQMFSLMLLATFAVLFINGYWVS